MLYYPDSRIQHAGVVLGIRGVAGHEHRFCARGSGGYFDRLRVVREVSAVTGACLFVRRETYRAVGESRRRGVSSFLRRVDFCMKLRGLGFRNLCTPFAELYRHKSVTRGSDLLAKPQSARSESRRMRNNGVSNFMLIPITRRTYHSRARILIYASIAKIVACSERW